MHTIKDIYSIPKFDVEIEKKNSYHSETATNLSQRQLLNLLEILPNFGDEMCYVITAAPPEIVTDGECVLEGIEDVSEF